MAKKGAVKKKTSANSKGRKKSTEKILVENFVSLQKIMADMSVKFDNLAGQISSLLDLFESSARSLAEKDFNFDLEGLERNNERFEEKLDGLLEQNKVIARGLTLIHENNSGMPVRNPPREGFQGPPPERKIRNDFAREENLNGNQGNLL